MPALHLVVHRLADIVEEAAPPREFAIEAALLGDDLAHERDLDRVAEHILSVARAVLHLAHRLDDLGVHAPQIHFEGGILTSLDDLLVDLAPGFFDDFFDPRGVEAAVGDESLQ